VRGGAADSADAEYSPVFVVNMR